MAKLIKIRNKVMHFKPIGYGEFNDNLKNCEDIIRQLYKAEKEIDFKFNDTITEALLELANTVSSVMKPIWNKIEDIKKQPNNIFSLLGKLALDDKEDYT